MEGKTGILRSSTGHPEEQGLVIKGHYSEGVGDILRNMGLSIEIKRASHVDIWYDLPKETQDKIPEELRKSDLWWADMSPTDEKEGTLLGPFLTRGEALDAEHCWLSALWQPPDTRRTV